MSAGDAAPDGRPPIGRRDLPIAGTGEERVTLDVEGAGEVPARLERLCSTTLTVRLAAGAAAPAALADRVRAATLVTRAGSERLADLVVTDAADDGGERILTLAVADARSRGRLWAHWDALASAGSAPAPGHPDVGDVPARGHYTEVARRERLRWIRQATGAPLGTLDEVRLDVRELTGNIENVVGTVEVPVGLAGPLLFDGANVRGRVTAPLATTEGALVASVTRGSRAITRAGGVRTQVISQRMSRAPVYEFADVATAARFARWVGSHLPEIEAEVRLVSRHARLVGVRPIQIGRVVNLRFNYETGDAAGQNMTTACTWRACQWISQALAHVPGLEPLRFRIEGNASGDKKVNYLSIIDGRGMRVTAEAFLDRRTVVEVLKTTPEDLAETVRYGVLSSLESGMPGHNINTANLVAGIFTSTGQDIACVHESSVAILSAEARDDGLYASILLPALIVGTVGGGTSLPNQRDYLEMMGCAGAGKVERLAEIVAGFALALDLSTVAAVSGGQFADAHERLGRNRPVAWFTRKDLDAAFFTPMLAEALGEPELEVTAVTDLSPVTGSSIITEVTGQGVQEKLTGLLRLRLEYAAGGLGGAVDVVTKLKPLDSEVILTSNKIASLCGGHLAEVYPRWRDWTGFKDVHTRELGLYRAAGDRLRAVMPRLYGVHEDPTRETYAIVMEDLAHDVLLKDSASDRGAWAERHVDAALRGIAGAHAAWLGREAELAEQPWLGRHLDARSMVELSELWLALAEHNATEYPEWIDEFTLIRIKKSIDEIGEWWPELERMPRTLVHNDFNPRNIALRADGLRLVAYDWELATIHVPQRDLAELLAFTLPAHVSADRVEHHLETHRAALAQEAGVELDRESWRRGYRLALRDFTLTRLQLYMMAHTQRQYDFLDDVVRTVKHLIRIEGEHDIASGRHAGRQGEVHPV